MACHVTLRLGVIHAMEELYHASIARSVTTSRSEGSSKLAEIPPAAPTLRAATQPPSRRVRPAIPPSDGDCLRPSRARCVKGTIPRLQCAVFTFEEAGCWLLPRSSGRQPLANAAIAAWRVGSNFGARRAPGRQHLASIRSGLWDILATEYAATCV